MRKLSKKLILKYVAVVGLLIFLHYTKIISPIESVFVKVFGPVFSSLYSIGISIQTNINEFNIKKDLIKSEKELTLKISELTEENAKYKTTLEENRVLKEYLDFLTANKYEYKMSNVISRGQGYADENSSESIIIDKGSRDGLYPGLAVVSSQGVIIGKVINVENNISEVFLVNSSKCKLTANILGGSETIGSTEGELGLTIKMNFIPQDEIINVGDMITTSGLEAGIPAGLLIGRVIEVKKESNDLWQTAVIEPVSDPFNLTIVSVILM